MKKAVRIFDGILCSFVILVFAFIIVGNSYLPSNVTNYESKDISFSKIFSVCKTEKSMDVAYQKAVAVNGTKSELKLFGVFPIKDVTVKNEKKQNVLVSGKCFGIKLYTDGVIVVGTQGVDTGKSSINPASLCGIQSGDIIVSINGEKVYSSTRVEELLNDNNGKKYKIKIKRNNTVKTVTLAPIYCERQGCYKAGMWVRDSTAGIGTITFFNEKNKSFATLGHPINDVDTNEIMPMLKGEAVGADVTKIYKGTSGETGSLCCNFSNSSIGTLSSNTNSGVYGIYTNLYGKNKSYEVASAQEIKRGDAQILTTIDNEPKLYSIKIVKINYNDDSQQKNLVIKVTDKELLNKTGGIIQGMSGSPVIQNGKLIAAVTHVIINNPSKGYAIFAEKMLSQSLQTK